MIHRHVIKNTFLQLHFKLLLYNGHFCLTYSCTLKAISYLPLGCIIFKFSYADGHLGYTHIFVIRNRYYSEQLLLLFLPSRVIFFLLLIISSYSSRVKAPFPCCYYLWVKEGQAIFHYHPKDITQARLIRRFYPPPLRNRVKKRCLNYAGTMRVGSGTLWNYYREGGAVFVPLDN